MDRPVGIGIIGAGNIGRVHGRALSELGDRVDLVCIADPSEGARGSLGEAVGCSRLVADPEALLADPAVEAVAICSSTDTHAPLIVAAAQAGKHIFCEKPLALELGKIDMALAAVDDAGVLLQVGFNRRFDRDFGAMREQIAGGHIGTPEVLRITSRDPRPPPIAYVERSGGLFLDMTIHDFDMARFLMDSEVAELHVYAATLVDSAIGDAGDVDTAVIALRFESGALGIIENSRRAVYGYDQRAEVHGSEGMIANGNQRHDDLVRADGRGTHSAPLTDFYMDRYADAYRAEMAAFVDAIRGGTPPKVTGRDGRMATVLGQAARRSWAEGIPVRPAEVAAGA